MLKDTFQCEMETQWGSEKGQRAACHGRMGGVGSELTGEEGG
jgi:hypothetical protein